MEKYIKADTILKFINGCLDHEDKITDIEKAVLTGIKTCVERIPAADVIEVVRCRECVFWDTSWDPGVGAKGGAYYCPRCHLVTLKDSFCSGACRKDGGQDNGTA